MSLSEYQEIFATLLELGVDLSLQPENVELQAQAINCWTQLAESGFYNPSELAKLQAVLLAGTGLDINLLLPSSEDPTNGTPLIII